MVNFKIENGIKIPLSPEEQADFDARNQAWAEDAPNRLIKAQILSIEQESGVPRAIREAIIDAVKNPNTAAVMMFEDQISSLRMKLTKDMSVVSGQVME